jgi:hypothetical protein
MEKPMGCLGKAVGLLILTIWTSYGASFLVEQKAHGESLLPPMVILGLAVLLIAALLVLAVGRFVPAWRRGETRGQALTSLLLAGIAMVAIYVAVDVNVANRRPGRELTAALAPACAGSPVAGAGSIVANGTANHLVVLDAAGHEHDWTGYPAIVLRPPSLSDAELVICIAEEKRATVEVCEYTNGPDITRYAVSRKVGVHEAATGRLVLLFTATAEPRRCQATESKELTELVGSLDWAQVDKRLAYLVAHGVDAASRIALSRAMILEPGESMAIGLVVSSTAAESLTVHLVVSYPAGRGGLGTEDATVTGLEPGERRVALAWPTDLAFESSVGVDAAVVEVEAGDSQDERRATARQLLVTAPDLPLLAGRPAVGIANRSATNVYASVTVGFLRDGVLVAVGQADATSLAAGGTASLPLDVVGDPTGATETITQVDVAYAAS